VHGFIQFHRSQAIFSKTSGARPLMYPMNPGIYIDVNNHFEIKDNNSQTILKILKENGEKILEHSKEIAFSLMEKNK